MTTAHTRQNAHQSPGDEDQSKRKGRKCVAIYLGHDAKGHEDATGRIIANGKYMASSSYNVEVIRWNKNLEAQIESIQEIRDTLQSKKPSLSPDEVTSTVLSESMQPKHPLQCEHVLCTSCIKTFGVAKKKETIELSSCPLETHQSTWSHSYHIGFKPSTAGVRILCLDG